MAREIFLRARVEGLELHDGIIRPVATCGFHRTGPDIVFSPPVLGDASHVAELECWARGILNSSNTVLVAIPDGYAPLGKGDGPSRVAFGMQFRVARNEMSRDEPVEYLPSREHAEKMCLLARRFRGVSGTLAEILSANGVKPDLLGAKKLAHLSAVIDARASRNVAKRIDILGLGELVAEKKK